MSELADLYQELIIDHSRSPRNFGKLASANREAHGHNPLCGDTVTVYLELADGMVRDVAFEGRGCAISLAAASLLTDMLKGKSEDQARALFARFHAMMTGEGTPAPELDKLAALAGVRAYPMRVKCATLAGHTMLAALDRLSETSTE